MEYDGVGFLLGGGCGHSLVQFSPISVCCVSLEDGLAQILNNAAADTELHWMYCETGNLQMLQ